MTVASGLFLITFLICFLLQPVINYNTAQDIKSAEVVLNRLKTGNLLYAQNRGKYSNETYKEVSKKSETEHSAVAADKYGSKKAHETGSSNMGMIIIISLMLILFAVMFFLLYNDKTRIKKVSFKARILLGFISMVFLIFTVAMTSIYSMSKIGDEIAAIAEEDIPLTNAVAKLEVAQLEQVIALERTLRFAHSEDIRAASKMHEEEKKFFELAEEVDINIEKSIGICEKTINHETDEAVVAEFSNLLVKIKSMAKKYDRFEGEIKKMFAAANNREIEKIDQLEVSVHKLELEFNEDIMAVEHEIARFTQKSAFQAEADEKAALMLIIIFSVLGMVIAIVFGLIITGAITKPLRKVTDILDELAIGNIDQEIEYGFTDEIGQMVISFRNMIQLQKNVAKAIDEISGGNLGFELERLRLIKMLWVTP